VDHAQDGERARRIASSRLSLEVLLGVIGHDEQRLLVGQQGGRFGIVRVEVDLVLIVGQHTQQPVGGGISVNLTSFTRSLVV
jgi:hypothetical protein